MIQKLRKPRILAIRNDHIGDMLCTTPALQALRDRYPDGQIDVLASKDNSFIVKGLECIDGVYEYEKPSRLKWGKKKMKAYFNKALLFLKLLRFRYDIVIVFRGDYSPSTNLFVKFSRACMRIGVAGKSGEGGYTHPIRPPKNDHEVLYCFLFLRPLGIEYASHQLQISLPLEYKEKYREFHGYILCHVSARALQNKINAAKWIRIIQMMPLPVVISATCEDQPLVEEIMKGVNVRHAQTSSFMDLCGLVANVTVLVSLCGGITHACAALKVPVVLIAGKNNTDRWHPWGYKDYVVHNPFHLAQRAPELMVQYMVQKILEKSECLDVKR